MAATEDEARGFEIAGELQVGNALTGPQTDQAEADRIYVQIGVVSAEQICQIRYGLPPRPPLPPRGPALASGFPDPDPGDGPKVTGVLCHGCGRYCAPAEWGDTRGMKISEVLDRAHRLTVRLPDYMDSVVNGHTAQHMSLIGRAWMEVFPGLQARLDGDEDGKSAVAFRLTPQEQADPR